jgi:DNA-binding CsgD family transcriptional regulator
MLETLRGYGSRLLAGAGEQERAAAALAGYAVEVAGQAAAGLVTATGERAAARWLDAEDATTRPALGWAMDHDPAVALRLAVALAPWWLLRGRQSDGYPLLRQAAGHAAPGSDLWCTAQSWLGRMAVNSADPVRALGHFTALRDAVAGRGPSRALADGLAGRSYALANLDRLAEAAGEGRRALALARELGYPAGEAFALNSLALTAYYAGDFGRVVGLVGEADQIRAGVPPWVGRELKNLLTSALTEAMDLAAAERSSVTVLAWARDAGDLPSLARALVDLADLDLRARRTGDAAQHLRESVQIAARTADPTDVLNGLDWCGYLCATAGRAAEAVTVWAARAALLPQYGYTDPAMLVRRRREPLRQAREVLGEALARTAEDRGSAMSPVTATEYALLLTTPSLQPEEPPELAGLSARERELVTLVARGRTNAQIAAELFISVNTVSSHLERIRDKTGYRRRADLTRLALAAGLV